MPFGRRGRLASRRPGAGGPAGYSLATWRPATFKAASKRPKTRSAAGTRPGGPLRLTKDASIAVPVTIQRASSSMMASLVHCTRLLPRWPEAGPTCVASLPASPLASVVAVELVLTPSGGEYVPNAPGEATRTSAAVSCVTVGSTCVSAAGSGSLVRRVAACRARVPAAAGRVRATGCPRGAAARLRFPAVATAAERAAVGSSAVRRRSRSRGPTSCANRRISA